MYIDIEYQYINIPRIWYSHIEKSLFELLSIKEAAQSKKKRVFMLFKWDCFETFKRVDTSILCYMIMVVNTA